MILRARLILYIYFVVYFYFASRLSAFCALITAAERGLRLVPGERACERLHTVLLDICMLTDFFTELWLGAMFLFGLVKRRVLI